MKILFQSQGRARRSARAVCNDSKPRRARSDAPYLGKLNRPHETSGSALLIVLVLLGLMIALLLSNTRVLRNLHRQVQLVEKKQLRQSGVPEKKNAVRPNNP